MSIWRIGTEAACREQRGTADLPLEFAPDPAGPDAAGRATVTAAIDRLTKWIPGDVLALYVAAVTAFATDGAKPSLALLVAFVVLTPSFVLGAAFAGAGKLYRGVVLPAVLATVAFAIWTLSVPFSGWQRWSAVSDNRTAVAIVAAVAGVLFGYVAEGFTKRAARDAGAS